MCGIAGFVNREGIKADRSIVERMTASLAHRGPDGDAFHCEGSGLIPRSPWKKLNNRLDPAEPLLTPRMTRPRG